MITNIPTSDNSHELGFFSYLFGSMKERQIRSILILFFLSFIVFLSITIMGTFMHERVHGAINNQYGMDSNYSWEINGVMIVASTYAIAPENHSYNELCDVTCATLHMQNEIVTYNLESLINLIFAMFIIFASYYHTRWFNKNQFEQFMLNYTESKWRKKELKRLEKEAKQLQITKAELARG